MRRGRGVVFVGRELNSTAVGRVLTSRAVANASTALIYESSTKIHPTQ